MNRLPNQPHNQDAAYTAPCRELFIYYLKGRLQADYSALPENCIGNWEEEEDSFLFFSQPAMEQVENLLNRQPQLSFIDSYHMPYEQWLGETCGTFEHGTFRVPQDAFSDGSEQESLQSVITM